MKPLSSKDFKKFFVALYGFEPLPWQQNLLELVVNSEDSGSWPEALALPTASGKTAILAIAVFALACQADRPCRQRSAPRRILFVVDRRIIVDEAFDRASDMAKKLLSGPTGIMKNVADRLMLLAGGRDFAEQPLAVFQLRGGIYRDDAWARTPLQPTIVTSTVDQIGSRLFYRGYGVSRFSRPIHAGLAANDSLIILDEAHCSTPFYQSVQAIKKYRTWAEKPIRNPFAFVIMSATPPSEVRSSIFTLQEEDREHPVLKRRLFAKKPAKLIDAKKDETRSDFAYRVTKEALDLSKTCMATAVIVNRVATAKAVYDLLRIREDVDTTLLTGRMRPVDRDHVISAWAPFLKTGSPIRDNLSKPTIVVSTQCLEVGADLDFDGLVTECAAFDALCQRFGRLNRDGREIDSKATIIWWPGPRKGKKNESEEGTEATDKESEDPVYGPALKKTWEFLKTRQRGRGKNKVIQMGISDIELLKEELLPEEWAQYQSPSPNAPVLFPAHLDFLVQTDPVPVPDPDISLFLHGCGRGQMDVQVCWRADISSASQDPQKWIDAVGICPPTSAECMSVPLYVLRNWLNQTGGEMLDSSDVVGSVLKDSSDDVGVANRRTLCWRGPDDSRLVNRPFDVKPGDTVVIPTDLKGWDSLGFIPETSSDKSQVDVGDRANYRTRGLPVLRLFPDLVRAWSDSESCVVLAKSLEALAVLPEDLSAIKELLGKIGSEKDAPEWLKKVVHGLLRDKKMEVKLHPFGGLILKSKKRVPPTLFSGETFTSEDDSASRTVRVLLKDHFSLVSAYAKAFAEGAGLEADLVNDLILAAKHHDLGKADPRFQVLLRGGDKYAFRPGSQLLAKSGWMPDGYVKKR